MIESNACVYEKVEKNPIYQTSNDKDWTQKYWLYKIIWFDVF
jgi:hypothetical protein